MADPSTFTLDQLLEYISRGHAFPKHVEGMDSRSMMRDVNAFSDTNANPVGARRVSPRLGESLHVRSPEDLKAYMGRMIDSPTTRGFVETADGVSSIHLFNSADNTYMIINPLDRDFGTIHRYPDAAASFAEKQRDLNAIGNVSGTFDNSRSSSAALDAVTGFVDGVRDGSVHVPNAFRYDPGFYASRVTDNAGNLVYPGTRNLTTSGVTSEFRTYSDLVDSGISNGSGFVAAIDDTGKPSQMFFLNEATNTVAEIRERAVIIHSFDGVDEAQRADAAMQFFVSKNVHNVDVIDGGLSGVARSFQTNTPEIFADMIRELPRANSAGIPLAGSNLDRVISEAEAGRVRVNTAVVGYRSAGDAAQAMIGFRNAETALAYDLIPNNLTAADDTTRLAEAGLNAREARAVIELSDYKAMVRSGDADISLDAVRAFDDVMGAFDSAGQAKILDVLNGISSTPVAAADMARGAAGALDSLEGTTDGRGLLWLAEQARGAENAAGFARLTSLAADTADVASTTAQAIRGARASRFGFTMSKPGLITTVAVTTLAVSATAYANEMTRDLADQLLEQERITPEFHAEFRALMDDVGPILTGQAADPTPLAIPGMFIVERMAYSRFQELSNEHQLPEEIHDMLAPSIIAGTSLRGQIGRDTFMIIPTDTNGQPEALRPLIEARRAVEQAREDYDRELDEHQPGVVGSVLMNAPLFDPSLDSGGAGIGFDPWLYVLYENLTAEPEDSRVRLPSDLIARAHPDVQQADTVLTRERAEFQHAFDRALADPQAARALADLLTTDQLYEIVTETAKFNSDTDNPLVQQYLQAQDVESSIMDYVGYGDASTAQNSAEEALRSNPDQMRDYLSEIFVEGQVQPPRSAPECDEDHGALDASIDHPEHGISAPETQDEVCNVDPSLTGEFTGAAHPGYVAPVIDVSVLEGGEMYEGLSLDVINLDPDVAAEEYLDLLQPSEVPDAGVYYNLTDLPFLNFQAGDFVFSIAPPPPLSSDPSDMMLSPVPQLEEVGNFQGSPSIR